VRGADDTYAAQDISIVHADHYIFDTYSMYAAAQDIQYADPGAYDRMCATTQPTHQIAPEGISPLPLMLSSS
jgi:hypothetical protein